MPEQNILEKSWGKCWCVLIFSLNLPSDVLANLLKMALHYAHKGLINQAKL